MLLTLFAMTAMADTPPDLQTAFEAELASRNVEFKQLADGRYELNPYGEITRTISIENLARRYGQSGDVDAVARFVDSVLSGLSAPLPPWESASDSVFPMLESSDLELGPEAVARETSDETCTVLVYFDEAVGHIRFIEAKDLEDWGVSEEEAWAAAEDVLDRVMVDTAVGYLDAGELRLGTIEAFEPWKASLIRSRALRNKVESELGWPIYAVAPDRGFVYLLSRDNADELGRIGAVVVREYLEAPYPISTEVWEISDEGIKAIGAFPTE